LEEQTYGLLMSFLDGWLDVAPPGVKIVDGNENSYYYTDIEQFFRDALEIKVAGQNVVAPENRFKYRAQVQAGHALYLDRFAAKPGEKYFFDIGNTPKSTKIAEHATAALASSDEYVWIYGEKGRFWPEPGALLQWQGKEVFAPWPQVLAGSDTALSIARDPHRAALDFLRAHPTAPNLARNADFSSQSIAPDKNAVQNAADWQGDGAVAGWLTWQDDDSRGTFSWDKAIGAKSPGAARLSAISNGCFIQTYPVQAGKSFVLSAKVRQSGKGYSQITARWKDQNNAWTAQTSDVPLFATGAADAKGWRTIAGLVVVPPSATQMVLLLTAQGQKTGADQIWFDDVQVIEQTIE
jgi:hypothetical protein